MVLNILKTRYIVISKRISMSKQLRISGFFSSFLYFIVVIIGVTFYVPAAHADVTRLYSFTATLSDGHNAGPNNNFVISGTTLYAFVQSGGSNNRGTAEKIETDGTGYSVLYHFGSGSNPETPVGSPLLLNVGGTDYLYGVSSTGGSSDVGTIFRMELDGTIEVLHSFSGGANGQTPKGTMALSGSTLYGQTQSGGANSVGIIYSIDTDGSNFTVLHDFEDVDTNGASPRGGIMIDSGVIYAMTYDGGSNGNGTIYSYNIGTATYTHLHSFSSGTNQGRQPYGELILDGTTLYGLTSGGGQSFRGNAFKIQTDGSSYTGLHDFQGGQYTNGDTPYGNLLLSGGYLYGTAYWGGTSNKGVIYRVDTDGNNFEIIHSFTETGTGTGPQGSLLLDNSKFYGMTSQGGASNAGVIFVYGSDLTAPTITSVSSDTANGSYNAGTVIDIDVTFSEAVTSTGNVTVTLETGDTDRTCTFTVSSSTTGTCNYTIQAGDTSSDLQATISGTIKDASDNTMSNFTPSTSLASNKAIVIDTTNPTVSSIFPADEASAATTTATLILTFDSVVDVESGNITIYSSSDDSIVEQIDVTSDKVTGSGSATIEIDPDTTLTELTSYYIQIDATAFDDIAGNSYAGISDSTTWNFTIGDFTAPVISSVVSTPTSTGATITYTTDTQESTVIDYGLTNSYGSQTTETDTSPRVTSHTQIIPGLLACTVYHYRVISTDDSSNTSTGSDKTLTTTGCSGSATVVQQTASSIDKDVGATVSLNTGTANISLQVPVSYSANSAEFQLIQLTTTQVLATTGNPANTTVATNHTYSLQALTDVSTLQTSFDNALTITITYSDSEVSGLDESTLLIYRWDGSTWSALSNCSVNTSANTVSCETTQFSTFGLFGSAVTASGSTTSSGGGGVIMHTSTGSGSKTKNIQMGQTRDIGLLDSDGINILLYIGNKITFSIKQGDTKFHNSTLSVDDLDMNNKKVTLGIENHPPIELKIGQEENIDLDFNSSIDLKIIFNDLRVNRIDLTLKQLKKEESQDTQSRITERIAKPILEADSEIITLSQNLYRGMQGTDIIILQKFLNNNGFILAERGGQGRLETKQIISDR